MISDLSQDQLTEPRPIDLRLRQEQVERNGMSRSPPFHQSSMAAKLKKTMSVYRRRSNSSTSSIDSDDEALLHEYPGSREAKKRIVLKEFFVRAFLLAFPQYTYRSLMPLVSVELSDDLREAKVIVESSNDELLGHFIEWHREHHVPEIRPPKLFFSVLSIFMDRLEFEASAEDVLHIYNVFMGPCSNNDTSGATGLIVITNLSEDD